jgi:large subunit ribosomal protein L25
MKRVEVVISRREDTGKGAARSARREGKVPGVLYGGNESPVAITVNRTEMEKSLHSHGGENILVNLKFEGEGQGQGQDEGILGLVRDTQHDPLTGVLEHMDFLRVSTDKKITTTIPVKLMGNPKGVRDGGILEQLLRDVEIECFPLDIPDALEIDVTNLVVGNSLHVYDVKTDEKYAILTSKERAIALVDLPKVMSAAAGDEAGEPGAAEDGSAKSENESDS